ncbi:MAG: hypothetical protein O7G31_01120 [Calditrichaeota bacterium]|nr:hypothetical protein [Calditrichota bacterium]
MHENEISEKIIGAAIEVHRISVYEDALCHEFHLRKVRFVRQQNVRFLIKESRSVPISNWILPCLG